MDLIKIAEEAFATGKQHPSFKAGDTVTVAYRIVEGNKERVQLYRGVVIKIAGHGDKKRFTVRKMSGTIGVERIFPIVALNCTICVLLPVRKQELKKKELIANLLYSNFKIKKGSQFVGFPFLLQYMVADILCLTRS